MAKTIWGKAFLAMVMLLAAGASTASMIMGDGLVYRVVDGDTYIVNIEDPQVYRALMAAAPAEAHKNFNPHFKSFRIRLANVDTPESVHVDASRNTAAGKTASDFVKQWLEGTFVSFQCWTFDKYGRAICSVSKNGIDVGRRLIQSGMSQYVTRWGNHPFLHQQYIQAGSK